MTRFLIEHNRTVVFILDRDSATNPATKKLFSMDKLRSYLITEQQVHYIGGPNELEELFDDNQWAETANELWPRRVSVNGPVRISKAPRLRLSLAINLKISSEREQRRGAVKQAGDEREPSSQATYPG